MGRLSRYLSEYSNSDPEDIQIKDSIKFCCIDISLQKDVILKLNSFAVLNESLQEIIYDYLNGVINTKNVVTELKEDLDILFHLLAEEEARLHTDGYVAQAGVADKMKKDTERLVYSYHGKWSSILASGNPDEIIRTSDEILTHFNKILIKSTKFLDKEYSSYASISMSFLVLALLSNLLKQGTGFVNNMAARFINYYHRATNYVVAESLANTLFKLEKINDNLYKTYQPQSMYWSDNKCLVIEGDIKKGFLYKIYTETKPITESNDFHYSFLTLQDIMSTYEERRKEYIKNSEQLSFVRLAIFNCNNYAKMIVSSKSQLGD